MPSNIEPAVVSAKNQTFSSSFKQSYEEPTTNHTHATPTKAWQDSGPYTDISGPLPAFLRNEEMLLAPTVSLQIIAAAHESVEVDMKKEERVIHPPSIIRTCLSNDDYVDPQDAKNEVAAMKQHEKIIKKVSKGYKRTSDHSLPRALSDRDDYTTVSDALPKGDFERVERGVYFEKRNRASSDASPMLSSRSDSGKGSKCNSPKKSNSVRNSKKPKHVINQQPSKTQPIRRRSTMQQKEFVSFDPTSGFKLTAKRTNSDGVPTINSQTKSDGQESPVSDPGRSFTQHGYDEGFIEGFNATRNNAHVYAAVDLTAKCRPEDDLLRREGVGVPEHYIAPVTCN